ncbi:glycosyltransferase family 32 protein [Bacteroides finegoldii]|jgi:hypothetical protein|uniref:glycosyltransferase family 32 protein n=1 Tax=Bacteroides finegoldii TaxID=338188 RepID=UPI0022E0A781|nr:glycosyltransferase [Bacteroides finegoldii]
MIPKIIHYCWLSGDEFPDDIKKCIDSWKRILPDYEFRLWDTRRFHISDSTWVAQAFEAKKYAFAADYIRLYALYTEGGIYLDSDVMVFKSFNDLLHLPYFLGEDNVHCFEPAIIGAEKGCAWIKDVLDRYQDVSFVNTDGTYNMRGLPIVFLDRLATKYKFDRVNDISDFKESQDCIQIFPKEWFNSRDFVNWKQYPEAYCSHQFAGTWLKTSSSKKSTLKKLLPRKLLNFAYWIHFQLLAKSVVKHIQIPYKKS